MSLDSVSAFASAEVDAGALGVGLGGVCADFSVCPSRSVLDVDVVDVVVCGIRESINVRGYNVSGIKKISRTSRAPKRMALNQLIQAALTRLRKPPTVSLPLAHA
jgi:hypothetical protein